MEEKVIKMSLLVDKNTKEPVQVIRDDNVECYFSLLFPCLTFEGTIKDEFHLFRFFLKVDSQLQSVILRQLLLNL